MTKINIRQIMAESGVAFGTSGARGLVSQMTDQVCTAYTLAFLQGLGLAKPGQKIALGMDLRPSSPIIVRACAAGIRQAGCEVDFCGVLPTPALALYALAQGIPAIMVTGSHIPADRHGLKFYIAAGEITKADEAGILESLETVAAGGESSAAAESWPAARTDYLDRYRQVFGPGTLAGRRLGVFQHSSVLRDDLVTLLEALGATVVPLGRVSHFVPIDT
ncbi:MAG: phosphomannomutase, partial [Methylobacter sp.]